MRFPHRFRTSFVALTALALPLGLLGASTLSAEPAVPGAEQRVNQRENIHQRHPVAAFTSTGAALVVWETDRSGIQARLFGRDGRTQGEELTLVADEGLTKVPSAGEVKLRRDPVVAPLPTGDFLLFWKEERGYDRVDIFIQSHTVLDQDVYGQRFDAAGHALGDRFRVNTADKGFETEPKVAVRGEEVVVAWSALDDQAGLSAGDGIFARRFGFDGQALSAPARVSPAGVPASHPALAAGPTGRLLVTWDAGAEAPQGIFGRLYDAAFAPVGAAFRVSPVVAGIQRFPTAAAGDAGDFLVVWHGQGATPKRNRVFSQRVGADGGLMGVSHAVSRGTITFEIDPVVAVGKGDHYLVSWLGFVQSSPVGIFGVEVDAAGVAVGAEQKLNRRSLNYNTRLSVAADGEGGFVIPWEGFIVHRPGISAQRVTQN